MSSISNISNSGNAWAASSATRTAPKDKLFSLVDSDHSGGVDTTELQTLMDQVSKKTGVTNSNTAAELMTKLDTNSDGTLDGSELHGGITSIVQLPSTMEFAQARADNSSGATGKAGDDLFSKVDSNADGSLSSSEFAALMDKMSASSSSSDKFSSLDKDGDGKLTQAEFDAGRPSGAGGPPPGPAPTSSSSDSTTYDPLDTNKDGVVSAAEAAAGEANGTTDTLQALLKAIDTNKDGKLSNNEADAFVQQVSAAIDTLQKSSTSTDSIDVNQVAQQVLKQYTQIAAGSTSSAGSTVSVTA
jgi:Ca2+-binding EF-hand superfamily protein